MARFPLGQEKKERLKRHLVLKTNLLNLITDKADANNTYYINFSINDIISNMGLFN
jgi:hypothetical protein